MPRTSRPHRLQLHYSTVSDVGRVRKNNEDACLVDDKLGLFLVADGMGGHASGEVASRLAISTVHEAIAAEGDLLQRFQQGDESVSRRDILRMLELSLQRACAVVHHHGLDDEQKRGMGTTLDALLLLDARGFVAHVGDSRVYLYRQGLLHQLTEDHSLINELIKRGRLSREEIGRVHQKNAVTRAIGVYESVDVDVFDFDLLGGDRFLLCSDGLYNHLQNDELARLLGEQPQERIAQTLVALANERGGNDNITVVHASVAEVGVAPELEEEVQLKIDMLQKMPLFRQLDYQDVVRVLSTTEVRTYQDGASIVQQGEEGDAMFLVLEGTVRVHVGTQSISQLGVGQHFGEMALIDKSPRSASVDSQGTSKLLIMRRQDFLEVVRSEHALATKLLWSFVGVLSQRLRATLRELQQAREMLVLEDLSDDLLGLGDGISPHASLDELEAPTEVNR